MKDTMKRTLHTIYAAALTAAIAAMPAALLSGCSATDGEGGSSEGERHSISFSTKGEMKQLTNTSKATNNAKTTEAGLETLGYTTIYLYGYKTIGSELQNVMPGYTLNYTANSAHSSTTNSSDWEYVGQGTDYLGNAQEIKYWDGNSSAYRFFGVLPKYKDRLQYNGAAITSSTNVSADGSFSMLFDGLEYMTHTSDGKYYDSDGKEVAEADIPMYGTMWEGDPASSYDEPVPISFAKPYALVRVVFERPDGTSTTVLGKAGDTSHPITFGPKDGSQMAGSGEVSVKWAMAGSREDAEATVGSVTLPTMTLDPVTLTDQDTRYQTWPEYLMIPATSAVDFKCTAYTYTVNASGTDVFDERNAIVPAAYMQWKPGYQYTYVFKVTSTNQLEFSHVLEVYTKWQAGYSETTTW